MVTKWKAVGDRLGVPASELDIIQENSHGRVDPLRNCLREMFLWWLRNGKDVTARKLANAAHNVGEHEMEARINEHFGT